MTVNEMNKLAKTNIDDLIFIIMHTHLFKESTVSAAWAVFTSKAVQIN